MPTSAILNSEKKVKLCRNCKNFYKTSEHAGCAKGIWKGLPQDNDFFYDPYQQIVDSDFDAMYHLQIWENGVECSQYDGSIWIITEISCDVTHDTFSFANGQTAFGSKRIEWSFTMREIGVVLPSTNTETIILPEGLDNNLTRWLKNLTL